MGNKTVSSGPALVNLVYMYEKDISKNKRG